MQIYDLLARPCRLTHIKGSRHFEDLQQSKNSSAKSLINMKLVIVTKKQIADLREIDYIVKITS